MVRTGAQTIKLKPADPFDLIRWLARSQSDPRKAVAELVQNSIDADARRIAIERRRVRHAPALVVRDDGAGILPELDRAEALQTIATNIGHSRKRGLTARQRHEQVVAGQYGIGLLGFWSVGHRMEIRSRVGGSPVVALRLTEDEERAEIARMPTPMDGAETYTEIAITELHETAQRALAGRRLADYLAAELRGSILAAGVEIEIHDLLVRGLGQKRFAVVPKRFSGERLRLPESVEVPDHAPAHVELYFVRGADGMPRIELCCAGTLVAEDIAAIDVLGLAASPWTGADLGGFVDFPGFNVPPGTRRGVVPDEASAAFSRAMAALAPAVVEELRRFERERSEAASRQMVQELRRALRGLRDRLPQYELPRVPGSDTPAAAVSPGGPLEIGDDAVAGAGEPEGVPDLGETAHLFPLGPLASVGIAPARLGLAPGEERRVTAVARDADGRRVKDGVEFAWAIEGPTAFDVGHGARPAVRAASDARPGATARLRVAASQGTASAAAESELVVTERSRRDDATFGVPEPESVDDGGGLWRSRFDGERWQINAAHPDYLGAKGDPRTRFRYLLACLVKELVQRTHPAPGSDPLLEAFVEILAHAERNLREPGAPPGGPRRRE